MARPKVDRVQFSVRLPRALHGQVIASAESAGLSVNQWLATAAEQELRRRASRDVSPNFKRG